MATVAITPNTIQNHKNHIYQIKGIAMREALIFMVNRNIEFLKKTKNHAELERIVVHSNHLKKIASKHKYYDIGSKIHYAILETFDRFHRSNKTSNGRQNEFNR